MRALAPAKKRINPWKVARWTGLAVIAGVLGYCLIVWPWVIALTADVFSSENVDFWPGMVAAILIFIQGVAAVSAFLAWVAEGGLEAAWKWLKEREVTYDRRHTPEDGKPILRDLPLHQRALRTCPTCHRPTEDA